MTEGCWVVTYSQHVAVCVCGGVLVCVWRCVVVCVAVCVAVCCCVCGVGWISLKVQWKQLCSLSKLHEYKTRRLMLIAVPDSWKGTYFIACMFMFMEGPS